MGYPEKEIVRDHYRFRFTLDFYGEVKLIAIMIERLKSIFPEINNIEIKSLSQTLPEVKKI